MDNLLKDNPALKEEYDDADDERRDEIKDELRRESQRERNLKGALGQDPERKKKYEALPAKEKCAAAAALVVEFRLQRGLSCAAKRVRGASGFRGVYVQGRDKTKWWACISQLGQNIYLGTFTTVCATPPCPPLRPAHCIPLSCKTALRLRTELHVVGAANAQRRRRRRRGRTTRQHAFLNGRSCAISSWSPTAHS
jgi:hypothetical protein